jgi:hypothetical protein
MSLTGDRASERNADHDRGYSDSCEDEVPKDRGDDSLRQERLLASLRMYSSTRQTRMAFQFPQLRPVAEPQFSREALKGLQMMLTEELSPIEEMWERRN